jgi:pimeloyl-ACP methyl ester carboxylesterase
MMNKTHKTWLAFGFLLTAQVASANPLDFIFGAGSFGRKAGTTADCRNIIQRYVENTRFLKDETWRTRVAPERAPDFLNDLDYLNDTRFMNSTLGIVDTKFVKEFDTQIYYTATAKPLADGTIPIVDPEAKALVVYLHGSGTKKASGVGFVGKMNALAKMGYSSLSFDLPFHALGSRNPALAQTEAFTAYMDRIIQAYKVPGQKVIFVGHSFGPDVIAEYITRYPHNADAAVLISPGSFDKVTQKWYDEKTSMMDFGDTETNDLGGRWATMVTNDKIWDKPGAAGRVDPTIANKDLDVYVITGDKEEYIPGELDARGYPTDKPRSYDVGKAFRNFFSRVDVTVEPGVGHYIFNHKDANGQDVVLRSVLRANGENLAQEKELKRAFSERMGSRPSYDLMALRLEKEPFFRAYLTKVAAEQGKTPLALTQELRQSDNKAEAAKILSDYLTVDRQRVEALQNNIRKTAEWAPEFYRENKAAIDVLGEKGDHSTVTAKYLAFLDSQPPEVVQARGRVSESVFVIAERKTKVEPKVSSAPGEAVSVPPEMKAAIMREPVLKNYVVSHNSKERSDVVQLIGSLKLKHPELSNEQLVERVKSLMK